jgi:ribosome biogenesis GTPase / thiamine phosphate phosphatase
MRGLIIRSQSGFYVAVTEQGNLTCRLRGRLKRGRLQGDVVAVGDWVQVMLLDGETGVIEEVEPRVRMFSRLAPNPQGDFQQVLIANLDQAVLVFACAQPAPHFGMLDRFLVIAEKQGTPVLILANKVDLAGLEQAQALFDRYAPLGYEVIYTSAQTGLGVAELRVKLAHKISLFTGPSGVGKSSLLNAVQPNLGLQVCQVSHVTSKGRHTTVVREMFPLEVGGYVADTPGLKALALWDIEPEELDAYFPEMRDLVRECQFSDCTHVHEPGCAVLEAVQKGQMRMERYQSYLHMRFGEQD